MPTVTATGFATDRGGTPGQQAGREDSAAAVPPPPRGPAQIDKADEATAGRLIADAAWWAQEEFAGRRALVLKRGREVAGFAAGGEPVELHPTIVEAVSGMLSADQCLLDGVVAAGDVYHAFGALERDGRDLRQLPYAERYAAAVDLADGCVSNHVRYAPVATELVTKRTLLRQLREGRVQGVVFVRRDAAHTPHAPGRRGHAVQAHPPSRLTPWPPLRPPTFPINRRPSPAQRRRPSCPPTRDGRSGSPAWGGACPHPVPESAPQSEPRVRGSPKPYEQET